MSFLLFLAALSAPTDFHPGKRIPAYGKIAAAAEAPALARDVEYKVLFDVSEAAKAGERNRRIESAARLLNLYAAAGVPDKNAKAAVIVHGGAHADLMRDSPSAGLVSALLAAGVRIELCGQTAAYHGVRKNQLVPGVVVGLSAMTSHAVLMRQGYTLNPF